MLTLLIPNHLPRDRHTRLSREGLASVADGLVDRLVVLLDDVQAVGNGGLGDIFDEVLYADEVSG